MTFVPRLDRQYRSVRRLTQPAVEPVTLAEAKAHLRVDVSNDDALISAIIKAAREYCEEYCDRSFVYTQWQAKADQWPIEFEVPRPPIATTGTFTAVTLTYEAIDGTTKTVAGADYRVDRDSTPGVVRNVYEGTWPSDALFDANAITLTFWAGYGADGTAVPAAIRSAMLMMISHMYEHRTAVLTGTVSKEIEFGVKALLDTQRWGSYR